MTVCDMAALVRRGKPTAEARSSVAASSAVTSPESRASSATSKAHRRPHAALEIGLLALLYLGYSGARLLADADLDSATSHAYDLLHLETLLHLDVEQVANQALGANPVLALIGSYWYSLLHYVVTPAVLFWAYRARPVHYRRVRNALVSGTAIGLVGFTLLPMAPPRMLPGYVDTLATTAQHGWWGGDASAPRGLGALTNQLAAMPSLHVGWALWCAWVVVTLTRRTWVRVLAVIYPVGTTVVVIGTANHYLLDAVAGVAVMVLGIWLTRRRWSCRSAELAESRHVRVSVPAPRSAAAQVGPAQVGPAQVGLAQVGPAPGVVGPRVVAPGVVAPGVVAPRVVAARVAGPSAAASAPDGGAFAHWRDRIRSSTRATVRSPVSTDHSGATRIIDVRDAPSVTDTNVEVR